MSETTPYYQTSLYHETSSFDDTSPSYLTASFHETSSHLRVGAFNIRVFGQAKIANENVLTILVQVSGRLFKLLFYF